ncbi:hypothetical protein TFLX_04270 [Thermoflexales bacterium]|nr:hypothetical protein TFLX_04270 [Thermoflexales bacterium]
MNLYIMQLLALITLLGAGAALFRLIVLRVTPSQPAQHQTGHPLPFQLEITFQLVVLLLIVVAGFVVLGVTRFNWCEFLNYWQPTMPAGLSKFLCLEAG